MYDLTVIPDAGITGNTANGTYTSATNLTETLTNNTTRRQKVVYRFTPRIIPEDGGADCSGPEESITLWVHPKLTYEQDISDYNGYNISCYGLADGHIRINPSPELAPFIFSWTGPNGFTDDRRNISGQVGCRDLYNDNYRQERLLHHPVIYTDPAAKTEHDN